MPKRILMVCSIVVPIAGFLVFETVEARMEDHAGEAIEADARAFVDAYSATLADADPDRVRALYADDARFAWFTDGVRLYESAQDVLDGLRGFGDVRFETAMTEVEVTALGEAHAAVRADFRTAAMAEGAERFAFAGVLTMVLERGEDGVWRVVQGHSSTAGGPPGAGE